MRAVAPAAIEALAGGIPEPFFMSVGFFETHRSFFAPSSVRDRLRFEQRAASVFLKHIMRKDTDEAAIVAFGSSVQEKGTGMTNDANVLDSTIRSLQAGGETAMYDAIVLAGRKLRPAKRKAIVRPVIILITDGVDTASKASLRAAEEAATRSEASIFALDANSIYETDPK